MSDSFEVKPLINIVTKIFPSPVDPDKSVVFYEIVNPRASRLYVDESDESRFENRALASFLKIKNKVISSKRRPNMFKRNREYYDDDDEESGDLADKIETRRRIKKVVEPDGSVTRYEEYECHTQKPDRSIKTGDNNNETESFCLSNFSSADLSVTRNLNLSEFSSNRPGDFKTSTPVARSSATTFRNMSRISTGRVSSRVASNRSYNTLDRTLTPLDNP